MRAAAPRERERAGTPAKPEMNVLRFMVSLPWLAHDRFAKPFAASSIRSTCADAIKGGRLKSIGALLRRRARVSPHAACGNLYTNILASESATQRYDERSRTAPQERTDHVPLPGPQSSAPAAPIGAHPQSRGHTAADLIYAALRGDIISMRISPGQPVNEKQLALAIMASAARRCARRCCGLPASSLVQISFRSRAPSLPASRSPLCPKRSWCARALEDLTVGCAARSADAEQIATLRDNLDDRSSTSPGAATSRLSRCRPGIPRHHRRHRRPSRHVATGATGQSAGRPLLPADLAGPRPHGQC